MDITKEYLEKQLASLTQQAEQALATLHNANGAISAVRHLLEVLDAEATPSAPVEAQQPEAQN